MLLQPCCLVYVWTSFAYGRVVGELLQAFTWDHPLRWGNQEHLANELYVDGGSYPYQGCLNLLYMFSPFHYHSLSQIGQ